MAKPGGAAVRPTTKNFDQILREDCRPLIDRVTALVAAGVSGDASAISQAKVWTDGGVVRSGRRYRGAVIATAPAAVQREVLNRALAAAAVRVVGSADTKVTL